MLSNAMTQVWTFQTLREPEVEPKAPWQASVGPTTSRATYLQREQTMFTPSTYLFNRTPSDPLPNLVMLACIRS
jgi:hypothetical protein